MQITTIDIFCTVIDNFGDIGVVYRFAKEMKRYHPDAVLRVYVDDLTTFSQINFKIDSSLAIQSIDNITYINTKTVTPQSYQTDRPAKLLIEAFACEIPEFIMKRAYHESDLLINLEYLSAENWVDGYHLKESLLPEGSLKKYFFMPGFTDDTGGVLLNHNEPDQLKLTSAEYRFSYLNNTLKAYNVTFEYTHKGIIGTVFTYTRNMSALISCIVNDFSLTEFTLLIFGKKSHISILHYLSLMQENVELSSVIKHKNITFVFMNNIEQEKFDHLLYFTDFNIVRGEDSLVRAILAGNPFIWNAYLQLQKYQKVKVEALCNTMEPFFHSSYDFKEYQKLMLAFNDLEHEDISLTPTEDFKYFFTNLKIFKHSAQKMCYFVHRHCNLIEKISCFIENYQKS